MENWLFSATRAFLKTKACCGEEDLPDQMGQQHLCQQVGQPDEREKGYTWKVMTPYIRMQNDIYKRQLRSNITGQKTPV